MNMTMSSAPQFSIIIVVRNGVATIENALTSVFRDNETSNFECVVVDGASTDGTVDILKAFDSQIDLWISEPDSGIYDAMNKGIAMSSGKFLYFLGCDDTLLIKLDDIKTMDWSPNVIYYGNVQKVGCKRPYDGAFSKLKLATKNICHQSIFYPAAAFEREKYDLKYKIFADWEFNLRCVGQNKLRLKYIPYTIARFADGGVSAGAEDAFLRERLELVRRYLPRHIFLCYLALRLPKRFRRLAAESWKRLLAIYVRALRSIP